jgi:hypothetical protein
MHGGAGSINVRTEQRVVKVVVGAIVIWRIIVVVMVVLSALVRGHQECGARVCHVVN